MPEESATFTVDTTEPTVIFTPNGTTDVADKTTDITIAFNEPVRKAGGSENITRGDILNMVTFKNASDKDVAFNGHFKNNEIIITPSLGLTDGTYTITLLAGMLEDNVGHVITTKTVTFTINGPPIPIISFKDTFHKTEVTHLTILFDEPIYNTDGSRVVNNNAHTLVTLTKSGNNTDLAVEGTVTVNDEGTAITVTPRLTVG